MAVYLPFRFRPCLPSPAFVGPGGGLWQCLLL